MSGVPFMHRRYEQISEDWTHDHCEFCSAVFSEKVRPEYLNEGWATPYQDQEDVFRWVCPKCFEDFKEEFGWVVVEGW